MTAKTPTWDILVPTLGERRPKFERLLAGLLTQTETLSGRVRVMALHNDGAPSLAEIRQSLVLKSEADYVSFVDDDDLVSPDFVTSVVTALDEGPDYVGFQVQCYENGHPIGIAYHSLQYTRWVNRPGRFFRDISHINPIRASLARTADFRAARRGSAEDRTWAEQLRRSRRIKSEVVIDRIMYHYLHETPDLPLGSRWECPKSIKPGPRATIDHPYFSWLEL
jgi:hypothetical protein